jgi:glutamate-1-semialdehyde 2,1-aminomutase
MATSWPTSEREFIRTQKVIPGGVNSPARAFKAVGGHPIVIAKADGPFLHDVDGNRYIDYVGSWGPMILGHRHPRVVEAVLRELGHGMSYGAPTAIEATLAEKVVEAVRSIELVRMTSSGTEAAMSSIRLARGFTGRDIVVKFAGCYHGHVDSLLIQAGSGATTLGTPTSPGVPMAVVKDTVVLPFNDIARIEDLFREKGDLIACVILEPVVGNMGLVPPEPGFLEILRVLASRHGAVLIFDEVMTGFRLSYGGYQKLAEITPDLTVLGKIIGGGMPVGAYGGRADIMAKISPSGPVYQAGTLSGNPLAMASGLATLEVLSTESPYPRLEHLSDRLEKGLKTASSDAGIPSIVQRRGSMITIFFQSGEKVVNYSDACQSDTNRFARFFWKLMAQGIYWPCSQFEALFVSATHTEELIDETIAAARQALSEIAHEDSQAGGN